MILDQQQQAWLQALPLLLAGSILQLLQMTSASTWGELESS